MVELIELSIMPSKHNREAGLERLVMTIDDRFVHFDLIKIFY